MMIVEFIKKVANDIEMAFISQGITPVFKSWGNSKTTGCALTALNLANGVILRFTSPEAFSETLKTLEKLYGLSSKAAYCLRSGILMGYDSNIGTKLMLLTFGGKAAFIRDTSKMRIDIELISPYDYYFVGKLIGQLVQKRILRKVKEETVPACLIGA